MSVKFTEQHAYLIRHALGLPLARKAYRNSFIASRGSPDDLLWQELVGLGMAYQSDVREAHGVCMYHVHKSVLKLLGIKEAT